MQRLDVARVKQVSGEIAWIGLLTVTVSPDPIFITESLSFWRDALNSLMSLRVHIEAAARGGKSSTKSVKEKVAYQHKSYRTVYKEASNPDGRGDLHQDLLSYKNQQVFRKLTNLRKERESLWTFLINVFFLTKDVFLVNHWKTAFIENHEDVAQMYRYLFIFHMNIANMEKKLRYFNKNNHFLSITVWTIIHTKTIE